MATAEEIRNACLPLVFEFTVPPEFITFLHQAGDEAVTEFKEKYPKMWEHLKNRFPNLMDS